MSQNFTVRYLRESNDSVFYELVLPTAGSTELERKKGSETILFTQPEGLPLQLVEQFVFALPEACLEAERLHKQDSADCHYDYKGTSESI